MEHPLVFQQKYLVALIYLVIIHIQNKISIKMLSQILEQTLIHQNTSLKLLLGILIYLKTLVSISPIDLVMIISGKPPLVMV